MKKLQRKISLKGGGIFKGNNNNEEKVVFEEITLTETDSQIHANSEVKERGDERENMAKGQEQHGSRTGGRDKRVQRSKTDAHHSSASPARVPRRKHSQKTRTQPTIDQNCRICYGEFTQPKQLPCLHTFCQNCLEKFVNPKLLVECPTCREVS